MFNFFKKDRQPPQVKECTGQLMTKYAPQKHKEHYSEMKKYGLQNYRSYIKSEVVDGKYWITGNDSEVCDVCLENQKAGVIPLQATFPSGHLYPPAGELCRCSLGGRTDEDA